MKIFLLSLTVVFMSLQYVALANNTAKKSGKGAAPCEQIKKACIDAGFVKGQWKKGFGLWKNCINPIMKGDTSNAGTSRPLPQVDSTLVSQCREKHKNFGMDKKSEDEKADLKATGS